MGCANTKAGATAYGAPEEAPAEGGDGSKADVPKVVVDGEAQQQSGEMALNGSVVQNGADGDGTPEGSQEKCNGGVNGDTNAANETSKSSGEDAEKKAGDSTPSGEGETNENLNGSAVDGGEGSHDGTEEAKCATDEDAKDSGAAEDSGNDAAGSRDNSCQDGADDNAE